MVEQGFLLGIRAGVRNAPEPVAQEFLSQQFLRRDVWVRRAPIAKGRFAP